MRYDCKSQTHSSRKIVHNAHICLAQLYDMRKQCAPVPFCLLPIQFSPIPSSSNPSHPSTIHIRIVANCPKTIKMRWVVHLIWDYLLNAAWSLQLTLIFGVCADELNLSPSIRFSSIDFILMMNIQQIKNTHTRARAHTRTTTQHGRRYRLRFSNTVKSLFYS